MSWLTQSWDVTVRLDPLWTTLLLGLAALAVAGPPLLVSAVWAARFRRTGRTAAVLQRLIDCLPVGAVLVRPDGRVALANRQAQQYRPSLTPGAVLPADLARLAGDADAIAGGLVDGPSGMRLAAHAHALPTRRGREVLIFLDDATQRRQESDFASALVRQISHEMKTPLSVIRGHASRFAADGASDPAEVRRAWAVVDDEATRLTTLIDQAILMARFELPGPMLQRKPLNLRAICEEAVIDLAERVSQAGGEIEFEAADGSYSMLGDRPSLRQMLLNLIDNALKYGGPGVRITISLQSLREPARVRLAVRDTGPGIPAADLPLIFEKGFRGSHVRGSRAGSGLGLALVRSIAEWHGGTVAAESPPDGGACIAVLLPGQLNRHDR